MLPRPLRVSGGSEPSGRVMARRHNLDFNRPRIKLPAGPGPPQLSRPLRLRGTNAKGDSFMNGEMKPSPLETPRALNDPRSVNYNMSLLRLSGSARSALTLGHPGGEPHGGGVFVTIRQRTRVLQRWPEE
jgi:hypothetical protein